MSYKVLKPFTYAHDGINAKLVQPGDVVDIKPHLAAGLLASGHIDGGGAKADARPKAAAKAAAPADGDGEKPAGDGEA